MQNDNIDTTQQKIFYSDTNAGLNTLNPYDKVPLEKIYSFSGIRLYYLNAYFIALCS